MKKKKAKKDKKNKEKKDSKEAKLKEKQSSKLKGAVEPEWSVEPAKVGQVAESVNVFKQIPKANPENESDKDKPKAKILKATGEPASEPNEDNEEEEEEEDKENVDILSTLQIH